jgi:prolyl-tRNA editing enzyme YbaK/EbsC (Cys-tRNA(Pro) deacylase)
MGSADRLKEYNKRWISLRWIFVLELPGSTRTASDAAQAIGCEVGQIAKSLVFQFLTSRKSLLVIASGSIRVNVDLLRSHLGEISYQDSN